MQQDIANAGVVLQVRTNGDADVLPTHVTGGVPISQYLQGLLDGLSNPPTDPNLSLVALSGSVNGGHEVSEDGSSSVNTSACRVGFIRGLISWMNKHRRVRVRLPGRERDCYVWESVSVIPDHVSEDATGDDADASAEVPLPEEPQVVPVAQVESDQLHLNR